MKVSFNIIDGNLENFDVLDMIDNLEIDNLCVLTIKFKEFDKENVIKLI